MTNIDDSFNLYKSGIVIDSSIKEGVVVVEVVEGATVDEVLQKGDVITKINDEDVKDLAYLRYELYKHSVGDKIKITYIRDKKVKDVTVTLKGNPDNKKS